MAVRAKAYRVQSSLVEQVIGVSGNEEGQEAHFGVSCWRHTKYIISGKFSQGAPTGLGLNVTVYFRCRTYRKELGVCFLVLVLGSSVRGNGPWPVPPPA